MSPDELDQVVGRADFYGPTNGTIRDLIEKLRDTYCRTIGVEYQDISDKTQREWLALRMEPILNRPHIHRRRIAGRFSFSSWPPRNSSASCTPTLRRRQTFLASKAPSR